MKINNYVFKFVKYCDSLIGYPISQGREFYSLYKLNYEFKKWKNRRALKDVASSKVKAVDSLRRDGFVVLKNFLTPELVDGLRNELDQNIALRNFGKVIDMRGRAPGDLPNYLSDLDLSKGEDTYRSMTNYISIKQPLLRSKKLLEVVFHERILDYANKYLGCYVGVGSVNWRKSYANSFDSMDNQMFHVDKNCIAPLKVLVYLNDVGIEGGPFVYVRGSHLKKFSGWLKSHRYDDDKIRNNYAPDDIKTICGSKGDVIIANTSGIHKGLHPTKVDRYILVTSLNAQPEFGGSGGKFKISNDSIRSLSEFQKIAADFLVVE